MRMQLTTTSLKGGAVPGLRLYIAGLLPYNMFTIERIDIGESVKLSSIFLMGMTFPETLVIDLSKYNY